MGNCSISLVMNGIHKCSGACLYCSAAKSMDYRGNDNKNTFVFYKDKTHDRIIEYCKPQLDQDRENGQKTFLSIDIWGGNPVENLEQFKEVVDFCENELKEFSFIKLHTSGNGLELQDNDICDYLINHKIGYQLSHDGCGQWIRTGLIDPLYWERTKDNIVKLARAGILDWINCTLSQRNPSFFENIEYWNKWRKENNIEDLNISIKLNHIYDGTAPINKKWQFEDNKYIKKGEIIGDLTFHGETLHNYLHEFRKLILMLSIPEIAESSDYKCYKQYLLFQSERFVNIENERDLGTCVAFQRGLIDRTFAIDTKGEYCKCNLVDSDHDVLNSTAKQPEYCKNCKYRKLDDCNPCGSENNPEKCEYKWFWAETLEEMFQLRELISYFKSNNSCNCDGNCEHGNEEPIFCVRNYSI